MKFDDKKMVFMMLSGFVMISSASANSPYLVGQLGSYGQKYGGKDGLAGRVAAGYEWNSSFTLGKNISEPRQLNFNYGLELGYQKYETESKGYFGLSDEIHRSTIDFLAVLDVKPLTWFNAFIKLGPALSHAKENDTYNFTDGFHTTNYTYAYAYNYVVAKLIAGVGVNVTPKINLNVAYVEEYNTPTASTLTSVMGGIQFRFG